MTSRRLFKGLLLGAVAMLLLQAGIVFFQSSKDPDSGLAEARRDVAACEQHRAEAIGQEGPKAGEFDCPSVEEIRGQYDNRFDYADNMREVFQGIGIFSLFAGLVVGASFVGAEWGTGSMTTLLTWEPRRGRVLLAKLLASASVVAVVVALFLVVIALLFLPIATLRGTTEGVDGSFWWKTAGTMSRDIALSVFGLSIGIALATFTRSTAGAVGAGFFYAAIADPLLAIWRDATLRPWTLQYNVGRFLGMPVPDESDGVFQSGQLKTLSATRPAILLTIYAVVILSIAWAAFRSRDVT